MVEIKLDSPAPDTGPAPKDTPASPQTSVQPQPEPTANKKEDRPKVSIQQSGDTLIKVLKTQNKQHVEELWASGYFGKSSKAVDWNKVAISIAKFNNHTSGANNVKVGETFALPELPPTNEKWDLQIPPVDNRVELQNSARQKITDIEQKALAGKIQEVAQSASEARQLAQTLGPKFGGANVTRDLTKLANSYYKSFEAADKQGDSTQAENDLKMARAIDPDSRKLKSAELQFVWNGLKRSIDENDYKTAQTQARRILEFSREVDSKKSKHYAESAEKFLKVYGATNALRSELAKAKDLEDHAALSNDKTLWQRAQAKYESAIRLASENGLSSFKPWLGLANIRATGEGLEPPQKRADLPNPTRHVSGDLNYSTSDQVEGPLLKAITLIPQDNVDAWKQAVDISIKSGLYPEVGNSLTSAIDSAVTLNKIDTAARLGRQAERLAAAYLDKIPSLPSVHDLQTPNKTRTLTREDALIQVQKLAQYGGSTILDRLANTYESLGDLPNAQSVRTLAKTKSQPG